MNQQKITVSLELKALQSREFEGHGSVFNNIDLGGDIVMPGAFKRSLAQHRKSGNLPQMFWMHDPSRVPGKWLDMSEDERGLSVKGVLAETELGKEIHTLLKMDAVRGLSIGYIAKDQDFDDDGNRLIKEAELWEVSVVSLPMNPLAQVSGVKSQTSVDGAYVPSPREMEKEFRRMGCSKQVSRKLIAKIYDGSGVMLEPEEEETGATLVDSKDKPAGETLAGNADERAVSGLQTLYEDIVLERIKRMIENGWR